MTALPKPTAPASGPLPGPIAGRLAGPPPSAAGLALRLARRVLGAAVVAFALAAAAFTTALLWLAATGSETGYAGLGFGIVLSGLFAAIGLVVLETLPNRRPT